jgi:ATP-dependent DNA helicase PIF1
VNGSQGEVIGFTNTAGWTDAELQWKKSTWLEGLMSEFKHMNGHLCSVVKFANAGSAAIVPIAQESLKGTSKNRYMVCRTQIPLALALALSIHKSQGMTLEHVEISSQDIFESGQLCVGVSRATKLEGLTVAGYSREQMAMDNVLEFYGWRLLVFPVKAAIVVSAQNIPSRWFKVSKLLLPKIQASWRSSSMISTSTPE